MQLKFHKALATVFGIGYINKGGGTVSAFLYCLIYYMFSGFINQNYNYVLQITCVIAAGIWSSNVLEKYWGKDSNKIVVDEFVGMQISLLFISPNILNIIIAFVLFRVFDIYKPLLIKKTEQLPKGWGVMCDDILAGIYTNIILQIIFYIKLYVSIH